MSNHNNSISVSRVKVHRQWPRYLSSLSVDQGMKQTTLEPISNNNTKDNDNGNGTMSSQKKPANNSNNPSNKSKEQKLKDRAERSKRSGLQRLLIGCSFLTRTNTNGKDSTLITSVPKAIRDYFNMKSGDSIVWRMIKDHRGKNIITISLLNIDGLNPPNPNPNNNNNNKESAADDEQDGAGEGVE